MKFLENFLAISEDLFGCIFWTTSEQVQMFCDWKNCPPKNCSRDNFFFMKKNSLGGGGYFIFQKNMQKKYAHECSYGLHSKLDSLLCRS